MRGVVVSILLSFGAHARVKDLSTKRTSYSLCKLEDRTFLSTRSASAARGVTFVRTKHHAGWLPPPRSRSGGDDHGDLLLPNSGQLINPTQLSGIPRLMAELERVTRPKEFQKGVLINKSPEERLSWEEAVWWETKALEWQGLGAIFIDMLEACGSRWTEAVPEWSPEAIEGILEVIDSATAMADRAQTTILEKENAREVAKSLWLQEVKELWNDASNAWDAKDISDSAEALEWSSLAVDALAIAVRKTAEAVRATADKANGRPEHLWDWANLGGYGWAYATSEWDRAASEWRMAAEYCGRDGKGGRPIAPLELQLARASEFDTQVWPFSLGPSSISVAAVIGLIATALHWSVHRAPSVGQEPLAAYS